MILWTVGDSINSLRKRSKERGRNLPIRPGSAIFTAVRASVSDDATYEEKRRAVALLERLTAQARIELVREGNLIRAPVMEASAEGRSWRGPLRVGHGGVR